jgi:uncharacterized membrane protein YqaE (UPF0057 family)
VPPVGVYAISGCGADFFINICLTILGFVFWGNFIECYDRLTPSRRYFPGHIHAFYLEYVYYDRKEQARAGRFTASRAPGIYSERIQTGGNGYGTIVQPH